MKTIFTTTLFMLISTFLWAQAPQGIPYQAVMRNADGSVMASSAVSLTFMIHDGSASGTVVYQESHSLTSNAQGLVSCVVGSGVASQGNFANIHWGVGAKFLHVMMGSADLGTQQLLSVPYALYSESSKFASNGISSVSAVGDTLYLHNGTYFVVPGSSAANSGSLTGCIFPNACNYEADAQVNDGSCHFVGQSCNDGNSNTIYDVWDINCICAGSDVVIGDNLNCGASNVHNPNLTYGTITDHEGNTYRTIQMGVQEWMAENLKVSTYRNGDPMQSNLSNTEWSATYQGAWAYPGGGSSLECPFGKLYNWYAISDVRGVCPNGWHVPSDGEWTYLSNYISAQFIEVAKSMKSNGTVYWGPNDFSNSSGFSALPAGVRLNNGLYDGIGIVGHWWSSTEVGAFDAKWRQLYIYNPGLDSGGDQLNKNFGLSIRCLRD
jgi:uncharacterized protein (TIGR02145 family)